MKPAMNIDTLACWILNTTRSYQLYHPFVAPEFISFLLKSSSLPIIGDTSMSLAMAPAFQRILHTSDMKKRNSQFSVSGPGFFAPKKRALKFTDISDMQKGHDPVICIQETLPEIRQSKSGFWGCCDEMSLQWSRGTSSGLGILFSQGPVVRHEMRISLANAEFLPFSKEVNTLV